MLRIEFQRGSVHLPELGLWLDAHEPQTGPEKVFVSHAHSDHIEAHREMILSEPTARLMQARIGGQRLEHRLNFGEPARFHFGNTEFQITLLPAGHIFGSAMSLIEAGNESLLYTGDFKLRRGLSAEPCEPRRADVLIMETTFGQPRYVFPPTDAVIKSVIRFCREALDNDETPVLLGYSLGKSQEIMCGLGEAGLPLMLHGAVYKLTQIYEQFGQCFPKYERYDSGSARGKVLICPPNAANSAMLRKLGKTRSAILTGWAVDPNARYRYQCDAAFVLSDHADFPDLIEFVKRVQPKKVYTLHGFAADFARTLRTLGFDAQALSQNEQMTLELGEISGSRAGNRPSVSVVNAVNREPLGNEVQSANAFLRFAQTCAAISATSGKLEKVRILAEYFRELKGDAVAIAATWFSGRPFGSSQNKVLQLGWAVLRDALSVVAGIDEGTFHHVYLKHSDLGETAFELLHDRAGDASLSLERVDEMFHKIHAARGPLAKRPLLIATLERCSALEGKFLVKIITGDLRIGLKEGLVEEAVASAFSKTAEEVRKTNLLLGDIGETAKLAAEGKLAGATLIPFRPIKFMLASPEETAADIWERIQGRREDRENGTDDNGNARDLCPTAVWIEDKYDGVRCQLHKAGGRVALYSRDLKDITNTFPELAEAARRVAGDFILDGEIVAMNSDEVLPFSELQKRLGRREHDLFMREEVPIQFVAFDLLWADEKSYLNETLAERRRTLESLPLPAHVRRAQITEAKSVAQIEEAFTAARERGNEGLMIKDPTSVYSPGRRGLAWLKLKKALATLDCVVIGAEYGHGKRSKVLSDYTFAVRDDRTGELKTIGKAYSGLTDAEIAQLTEHFLKQARRQHGRYFEVEPDTVLEIAFDKLQPSQRHNSGLAMRFPRIARIRTDKSVAEIDTLETARRLVAKRQI
ncbi:MAG TPA: ATP-dependent DNA ligase [Verrucomicrobiae bacterium]|nr:ATP-dependent DNA ligase [Verrucomicrobiae bacterium]